MKSRMNREVHVRFCERFRGEIPLYLLDCVSCVASGYEDKISSLKMQQNFIRDDRLKELFHEIIVEVKRTDWLCYST